MAEVTTRKKKRAQFTEADEKLLLREVQKQIHVIQSKKPSGVTPAMKRQVNMPFF